MKNTATQKFLIIAATLVAVVTVVLVIVYTNTLKTLKGKTGQGTAPTNVSSPSAQIAAKQGTLVEANIGTVVDLLVKPDGSVTLTLSTQPTGQKTFQLPSDLKVKLYTSATETTSLPVGQLQKGTIINIGTFKNPDHYQITGVTDKTLSGKLL